MFGKMRLLTSVLAFAALSAAICSGAFADDPELDWAPGNETSFETVAAFEAGVCAKIESALNKGQQNHRLYEDRIFLRWQSGLPHYVGDGFLRLSFLLVDLFGEKRDVALLKMRSETGYRGEGVWAFSDTSRFLQLDWAAKMATRTPLTNEPGAFALTGLIQDVSQPNNDRYHLPGDEQFWKKTNFIGEKQINIAEVEGLHYLIVRQVLSTENSVAVFRLVDVSTLKPICYIVPKI